MDKKIINYLAVCFVFLILNCGSSSGINDTSNGGGVDPVEKLVGTPFEGMEDGTSFDFCHFLQGEFLTTEIPSLPIPIFLAFFNVIEEPLVREGIELANSSVGRDVFEVVDEWSAEARLIYKINFTSNISFVGTTYANFYKSNCDTYASNIVSDWQIAISSINSFNGKNLIAHELSHAFGMDGHYNVDFENDSISDPGETSLLRSGVASSVADPDLDEFIYMMTEFGNVLVNAIENDDYTITGVTGPCIDHLPDELLTQIQDNYDSECN